MPLLIGMDEAGLGPNLGPFVVAVSVWEVPDSPAEFDFWTAFEEVLTNSPRTGDHRLHVADSKQVFQPQKGLRGLEQGVRAALALCGNPANTYQELCQSIATVLPVKSVKGTSQPRGASGRKSLFDDEEVSAARSPAETFPVGDEDRSLPWHAGDSMKLPIDSTDHPQSLPWKLACERLGVKLVALRADVVEPLRFNRLVRQFDNKSQATSRLAMNLLRSVWTPADGESLVVADKHGGRNRYDTLLTETFGPGIECINESAEQSVYRYGSAELRFQPRAEIHGPVAIASMTAKYLRELAMHQFNRFWQGQVPGLKATQGYPLDARRFRTEIADEQRRLKIDDAILWRER